jgi:transposase
MARPTKLNPEISHRIVNLVRAGNYRETAAAAAGINPKTLRNWLHRGSKGGKSNAAYAQFSADLDTAEAEAELRDNKRINDAAEKDWRAAAWRLARKNPDRWGDRQRFEHTGADGGPIQTNTPGVVMLPPEDPLDDDDRALEDLRDREGPLNPADDGATTEAI